MDQYIECMKHDIEYMKESGELEVTNFSCMPTSMFIRSFQTNQLPQTCFISEPFFFTFE